MKKKILFLFTLLFSVFSFAQTSYSGNGNTGFGGTLGGATLSINDDNTTITLTFSRGGSTLDNPVVIYVDSKTGGFSDTTSFTDDADGGRKAVSTLNGTDNPTVTFPSNFTADYALVFNNGFSVLFELTTGSHTFIDNANIAPSGDNSAATHTLTIDYSEIGMTATDNTFKFVATYISETAFLSNEVIGDTSSIVADSGGTNPGVTGAVNFSAARSYTKAAVAGVNDLNLSKINIYKTSNSNLRITGLQVAETVAVNVFDILGKELLVNTFKAKEVNDIALSSFKTGVYLIHIATEFGIKRKKIIIK